MTGKNWDGWDEGTRALCEMFAKGRIGAERFAHGPETGFKPYWAPKVAGRVVSLTTDGSDCYATRELALEAAREYRRLSRSNLPDSKP